MFGVPRVPLGPKIMLKQEKVKNSNFAWHSGGIPDFFSEFTRFGITHVQVNLDGFFWQILEALSID